jgi:hypothetical protein
MNPELLQNANSAIDYHSRMASNWASKEALADLAQNPDDVEKCQRQRASHLKAADTIRSMIKLLQRKPSSKTFVPPTLIEVIAFAKEHEDIKGRWPIGDIKSWFGHFNDVGWVIGRGKKMVDWKGTALNGFKNWCEKYPEKANGSPTTRDPDGWLEYLNGIGHSLIAYRYAPDHLKTDFRSHLKGSDGDA